MENQKAMASYKDIPVLERLRNRAKAIIEFKIRMGVQG
jgi:hypothetical protein